MILSETCFVIEAPGKIPLLTRLLEKLGHASIVVATGGHVCRFPDSHDQIGVAIDGDLVGREYRDEAKRRLIQQIRGSAAKHVLIATDDDEEGDVIALDVARLIQEEIGLPVSRLRMSALTVNDLKTGLANLSPVLAKDATSGLTRVMIDRLIGTCLSDETHGAGRVLTPLLRLAAEKEYQRQPVDLVFPSEDGRIPFSGKIWLLPEEISKLQKAITSRGLPVLKEEEDSRLDPYFVGTGEIMLRASEERQIDVSLIEQLMQSLYEEGRISYCRAYGNPIPRAGLAILARSSGIVALPDELIRACRDGDSRPLTTNRGHPAPHLLDPFPLTVEHRKLDDREGLLLVVGRSQAETCLQRWTRPKEAPLKAWIRGIGLSERMAWEFLASVKRPTGRRLPWILRREPGLYQQNVPLSGRILRACLTHGLGRPSTYAAHISGLLNRNLVNERGQLTSRGIRWLEATPEVLQEPVTSRTIEELCRMPGNEEADHREPWKIRFQRVMNDLPGPIKKKISEKMTAPDERMVLTDR